MPERQLEQAIQDPLVILAPTAVIADEALDHRGVDALGTTADTAYRSSRRRSY
jgi:hypothetical protein